MMERVAVMDRPRAMPSRIRGSIAGVLAVLVLILVAGPSAQAAPSKTPITDDVTAFRSTVIKELDEFMATYGPRLSAGERAQLDGVETTMTSQLSALIQATSRAERLAASGASRSSRMTAAANAVRVHAEGMAAAQKSLAEVQPVIQPHLSFFEALSAKSTFDRQMSTYQGLGTQLQAFQARQRR